MNLLFEDCGYIDLTTFGLKIGDTLGTMSFAPKEEILLSGCEDVRKILEECDIKYKFFKKDGELIAPKEKILECSGDATSLHKAWKISQNIFEYMSGIATYTYKMTTIAQNSNPNMIITTTRKNFPGAKKLMLKAVLDGGGVAHRMGLYDSILIFKEHMEFFTDQNELAVNIKNLKNKFLEKKIAVEVDSFEQAEYFASLSVDILQCEKMSFEELTQCVNLKNKYPSLLLSATGGITIENIDKYTKTGVDFVVTSSPYHAKPIDIKVDMKANKPWLFVNSL